MTKHIQIFTAGFCISLMVFSSLKLSAHNFRPGKDFALFFAINDYTSWEKLKNPIADAEAIATMLREHYGFVTEVIKNPTKTEILSKIEEYRHKTYAEDAQLFIFFTGHGDYTENSREGFFIPKDGQKNDLYQESYIPYPRLKRWIETLPCRHIFVAIDACYSGTFCDEIAMKGGPGQRPGQISNREQFIRTGLQYRSRIVMASAGKSRTPDQSSFVLQFLAALRSYGDGDGFISRSKIWSYIEIANPKPINETFGTGDLQHESSGDFFFIVENAPETGITPSNIIKQSEIAINTDLSDWNTAKSTNTIEGFEVYLQKHPGGEFEELAQSKITALRPAPVRKPCEINQTGDVWIQNDSGKDFFVVWNANQAQTVIKKGEKELFPNLKVGTFRFVVTDYSGPQGENSYSAQVTACEQITKVIH